MGFFLTKAKKSAKVKESKSRAPKSASKNSKETLNRLGCKACPLDKAQNCTPKMQPDLAPKTNVYILGDTPHERDDEKGFPFDSKAGRLLRSLIGFDVSRTSFDNVIRDFAPEGVPQNWVPMECCRSNIIASIELSKPQVILGLGILPLQWMLNSSDMVGLRGRVFAVKVGNHDCFFIPTYHPQFIIEKAFNKDDPLRSALGHCLKFDIKRAFEAVRWETPEIDTPQAVRAGVQTFTGHKATDLANVLRLLSEAAKAPIKTFDIETYPLKPYAKDAKLLTAAFSFEQTNFSFAYNHPQAGWKPDEKKQIKRAFKAVLTSEGRIIAHNTPFEVEWCIAEFGKKVVFQDQWDCTMMQSHFIDERRGKRGGNDEQFAPNPYQALDFLVKQYFGIAYKSLFKIDRKRMDLADLEETLVYNGADTKYTLKLHRLQKFLLNEDGMWVAYVEARSRQPVVALMTSIGIDVDQEQNKKFRKRLGKEIKSFADQISAFPEVQQYEKDTRQTFNPDSQPELLKLLKNYIKVGDVILRDGKETTDKATLLQIKHPIARLIDPYRNRSKLKSTYADSFEAGKGKFIYPDGKIHPSFNTTFAETGRTSSDEPNQQNWPSRNDKWIRRQIVAKEGYVLVAFDYGQLEACTTAMCTKDKVLVKALWENYDIHMDWAIRAAKIYPDFADLNDEKKMGKFRSLVKNKLVFPAFFGAKNSSVNGYLRVATGLDVPDEVTDELMADFWRTFHGVGNWQKRTMNDYYEMGFIPSPTGRRRHYPLTKNQAVNYPIQSVACDIVCRAMVQLSRLAADTDRWYLHPIMNIHDDLTFCIPDDNRILEESIETIYRTMLDPGYDFINVPLSVTGSIGQNWLDMDEIGKFWSHKDL